MKMLFEENETLTEIVNHAGRLLAWTDSQIYKPKFSSKNPTKKSVSK